VEKAVPIYVVTYEAREKNMQKPSRLSTACRAWWIRPCSSGSKILRPGIILMASKSPSGALELRKGVGLG
jgi:hypothetical protein